MQHEQPGATHDRNEDRRLQRGHVPFGEGTCAGTRHHRVELLLDETVQSSGRSGYQSDAGGAEQQRPGRRQARRGQKHADNRGEYDERDDARLAQPDQLLEVEW